MRAGLRSDEIENLVNIDREGLEMFAHSLQHKKAQKLQRGTEELQRGTEELQRGTEGTWTS
jgi:hypothetical protein